MSENYHQLREVDGKLDQAVRELRAQNSLVATINFERANHHMFLALLSNALRQFGWLEKQRKSLIQQSSSIASSQSARKEPG
jgi:hypothetical protein